MRYFLRELFVFRSVQEREIEHSCLVPVDQAV